MGKEKRVVMYVDKGGGPEPIYASEYGPGAPVQYEWSEEEKEEILRWVAQGATREDIYKRKGCTRPVLDRHLRQDQWFERHFVLNYNRPEAREKRAGGLQPRKEWVVRMLELADVRHIRPTRYNQPGFSEKQILNVVNEEFGTRITTKILYTWKDRLPWFKTLWEQARLGNYRALRDTELLPKIPED